LTIWSPGTLSLMCLANPSEDLRADMFLQSVNSSKKCELSFSRHAMD
jgi:hypothetical protein